MKSPSTRRWTALLLPVALLGAILITRSVAAAAPANDQIESPATVPVVPYVRSQSTVGATVQPNETLPCGMGASVWFSVTTYVPTRYTVDTSGSNFDTVVASYIRKTDGTLEQVGCSTAGSTFQGNAQLSFNAPGFSHHLIQVGGVGGSSGDLKLNIRQARSQDNALDSLIFDVLPFAHVSSNIGATVEASEIIPCGAMGATVWYRFNPRFTGHLVLDTFGSSFDTVLAIWKQPQVGGAVDLVGCNDDDGRSKNSMLSTPVQPDMIYWIQVGGAGGDQGTLKLTAAQPPPNDDQAAAMSINSEDYESVIYATGADLETGEPRPCGDIGATVWYRYTSSGPRLMTIDTIGSTYDTVLAAYRKSGTALELIACSDDVAGPSARLSLEAAAGTEYLFQVGGKGGDSGVLRFRARPPSAQDQAPIPGAGLPGQPTAPQLLPRPRLSPAPQPTISPSPIPLPTPPPLPGLSPLPVPTPGLTPLPTPTPGLTPLPSPLPTPTPPTTKPANDDRADALTFLWAPSAHVTSNIGATTEKGEWQSCSPNLVKTIWYRFTPDESMTLLLDSTGSTFDAGIAAYKSNGSAIGCAGRNLGGSNSLLFQAQAGVTYYFQVGGFAGDDLTDGIVKLTIARL